MFPRKLFLTLWLCMMMFLGSVNIAMALNLVSDGQGAYYAADNQNFMLIDKRYMGPDHEMWNMVDLSTCEKGSWDGKQVVFAKVHFVMSTSDTASGPAFTFTFFSNGVYHTPGGTYQTISGSNAYRAVKVIFDRANGNGSSGGDSNSSSPTSNRLLSDDEIAIGGISPFTATPEYVRSIYGEPDKLSKGRDPSGNYYEKWLYGDSFEIWFSGENKLGVDVVKITSANGLATPAGIKVGSRVSEVQDKYGNPYFPYRGPSGSYRYRGRLDCDLVFAISNGVVVSIGAGWNK